MPMTIGAGASKSASTFGMRCAETGGKGNQFFFGYKLSQLFM
jgi:hypothetical protein